MIILVSHFKLLGRRSYITQVYTEKGVIFFFFPLLFSSPGSFLFFTNIVISPPNIKAKRRSHHRYRNTRKLKYINYILFLFSLSLSFISFFFSLYIYYNSLCINQYLFMIVPFNPLHHFH